MDMHFLNHYRAENEARQFIYGQMVLVAPPISVEYAS